MSVHRLVHTALYPVSDWEINRIKNIGSGDLPETDVFLLSVFICAFLQPQLSMLLRPLP